MTNHGSPSSEILSPEQAPALHWNVLQQQEQKPSIELVAVAHLRTNPDTVYETFRIESRKNREKIRQALPEFAKPRMERLNVSEDSTLYMSRTYGKTYIGRLSADDKSIIKGARGSVTTYQSPIFPEWQEVGGMAIFTAVTSTVGAVAGGLIQNGKEIFDTLMRGELYDRANAEADFANIGALIGTAPGLIGVGVLGYKAISRAMSRTMANTRALVADLHDIAERAKKQFVELSDEPRTITTGPDTTLEISAGKFVEDFLKDLSGNAVDYAWNTGLFEILEDVQAKQTALKDFDHKAQSFKVKDTAAQGIAAAMKAERDTALDDSLRKLIAFREEILPQAVRLSLDQGEQLDLR